jgi:hypothetical protein
MIRRLGDRNRPPGEGHGNGIAINRAMRRPADNTAALNVIFLIGSLALAAVNLPAGAGPWATGGPFGGTVRCLGLDPSDPAIVYAGTDRNGVFKTINGGLSWSAAGEGLPGWDVNAIAVDPALPSTVYAGTWGVYKSTDGGSSWRATGLTRVMIDALAIDPANPLIL